MTAFIAVTVFSIFFHVTVNAHTFHLQQDMHPAHHSSSDCVSNSCCFQTSRNNFSLERNVISSKILNLSLCVYLNENIELPYKPPKF